MKKTIMVLAVILAVGASFAAADAKSNSAAAAPATLSLADARGKIGEAIANPKLLTETIRQLSAADQKTFVADINAAIQSMPGSVETKAAAALNANSAAMKGARPGNMMTLLAEVFATASPEALTIINERFASDLFNRAADGTTTYSDAEFTQIAKTAMAAVNERVADTDQPDVRATFAALMFLRASNGTPQDLPDVMVAALPETAREMAKSDWIPSAMNSSGTESGGNASNYESMLAAADAGRRPDYDFALVVAGPQQGEALISDLIGKSTDERNFSNTLTPVTDAVQSPIPGYRPDVGMGAAAESPEAQQQYVKEPHGYQWQTTY